MLYPLQNVFKGSWMVCKDPSVGVGRGAGGYYLLKGCLCPLATSPLLARRDHNRILLRCPLTCAEEGCPICMPRVSASRGGRLCKARVPPLQTLAVSRWPFLQANSVCNNSLTHWVWMRRKMICRLYKMIHLSPIK